jgi:hypothetical protein
MILVLADLPSAETAQLPTTCPAARAPLGAPGGLRTERLSRKQLRVWSQIVAIVMAQDPNGQPLHPTLRRLWDAVDTSGHVVDVEMCGRANSPAYIGGWLAVTEVDPLGMSHKAVLVLNLRQIDNVPTKPGGRADGFIPFMDLRRIERYAELLGHELAHAVWVFADPERARLAQRLPGERGEQARRIVAAGLHGPDEELRAQVEELDRLSREVEAPAEAAEEAVWKELRASQRALGQQRPCTIREGSPRQ